MTDLANTDRAAKLLAQRYRSERRFKTMGAAAITIAALFLAILLIDVVVRSLPAFTTGIAQLDVTLDQAKIPADAPVKADWQAIARSAWMAQFPQVTERKDKRALNDLLSTSAGESLRDKVRANPALIGTTIKADVLLSSSATVFLQGGETRVLKAPGTGPLTLVATGENFSIAGLAPSAAATLIAVPGGVLQTEPGNAQPVLAHIFTGGAAAGPVAAADWQTVSFSVPESGRQLKDRQVLWLEQARMAGSVKTTFDSALFTNGDSREPEQSGILGALIGSLLTVFITIMFALPVGVAAAIYLQEFAPKNAFTDIIEVNINNLAAVPSIIFGLLGLAVFLNIFGLPRSTPLVGGIVLGLLVLPTIIITARAALRSIPPSITEAALGVGASKQQAVFHHVLPLAVPGILTGTILGVARALGETAPLLMIGMVAFIADIPHGFNDPATVLPVEIYMWSDLPEAAFQSRTAAAILVLLAVLFLLNGVAIFLRKRFERRW